MWNVQCPPKLVISYPKMVALTSRTRANTSWADLYQDGVVIRSCSGPCGAVLDPLLSGEILLIKSSLSQEARSHSFVENSPSQAASPDTTPDSQDGFHDFVLFENHSSLTDLF
jgi:hypothetical protein